MDTPAVRPPKSGTSTLVRLVDQVLSGRDAVVVGPGDRAFLLRDAVQRLRDQNCAVFHVATAEPDGLGLSSLLAQVAGKPDLDDQDDDVLDRGFRRLTVREPGRDRIVLVIDGADTLHDAVFRYLSLVCKAAEELQVVLAGPTDPTTRIGETAGLLRARLTAQPAFRIGADAARGPDPLPAAAVLAGPTTDDTVGVSDAPASPPGRNGHGRRTAWIIAGLGMAVSAVVGFGAGWQVRSAYLAEALQPAASTRIDHAGPPGHVSAAPITPVPDPGHPAAGGDVAPTPRPSAPGAVPASPAAAGRSLEPPPAAGPAAPPEPDPAPVQPPSPPAAATVPGPTVQTMPMQTVPMQTVPMRTVPIEPEQPPTPPADARSGVPSAAATARPAPPPALPGPRSAGQEGGPGTAMSPPRVRSVVPGASRARPPSDTAERRPHDHSRQRSETVVQEGQPQGMGPRSSQPVIGSFVVGPDGTRVFRPNP